MKKAEIVKEFVDRIDAFEKAVFPVVLLFAASVILTYYPL